MQFASRQLSLTQPRIMGILNVTPDSFFDGGQCYANHQLNLDITLKRVETMMADGADIIDVGGESTRPGAVPVSEQEECDRVLPVVDAICSRMDVVVSVDTSTAQVMSGAARLGAGLINDVRALSRPGALRAAVETGLPVCLMHMQGKPQDMQDAPSYEDPVAEVYAFLAGKIEECLAAGIGQDQLIVDPGIGFGKTDEHNLALMRELERFSALAPTLLGVSRKSMIGRLLNREPQDRLAGSLALAARGLQQGVSILRVHDVQATSDLVALWQMTENALADSGNKKQ